jgi:IMP dehydrogenase/GMP reductase
MTEKKFDLDDIVLIPAEESQISSRTECVISYNGNSLPLMASPMDTVVSKENYQKYINNGIVPCIPRGINVTYLGDPVHYFQSFGLKEIEEDLIIIRKFESKKVAKLKGIPIDWPGCHHEFWKYPNVLIDIANGHMKKLIPLVKEIKEYWPEIKLMVGNIANPETFVNLGMAGADFVRCSVGTGAGCTTAANVSINYPLGSLISECYKLRKQYDLKTKIVADGGMRNYSDIIKALALGADYIMCGSIFNKSLESAGFNYLWKIKINNKMAALLWKWDFPIKKKYRGMSTKAVQRNWGKTNLVTAEGITKYQKIEYTLEQWTENFKDYLRSAMSYCNAKTLEDFIGKAEYIFITEQARNRFLK